MFQSLCRPNRGNIKSYFLAGRDMSWFPVREQHTYTLYSKAGMHSYKNKQFIIVISLGYCNIKELNFSVK